MNRKKNRRSITAFLLVFVLSFQMILPACNQPAFAASNEVSSDHFSMTTNSFTINGTTITKAQLLSALSGAKRLPAGWQSNAARMGTLEYTQSPAFDPKVQAGLAGLGLAVAGVFAKIVFQFNLSTIANTEWYIVINGMPFIIKCTSSGIIINNISVPFNWLTYELAQYFSEHMNDSWYEPDNTVVSPDVISKGLGDIASKYGDYDCEAAAKKMEEYLKKQKQEYKYVTMHYPSGGIIVSLTREVIFGVNSEESKISKNGYHYGIEYNGIMFCNVHPYGLPRVAWEADFIGVGYRTVTPP